MDINSYGEEKYLVNLDKTIFPQLTWMISSDLFQGLRRLPLEVG